MSLAISGAVFLEPCLWPFLGPYSWPFSDVFWSRISGMFLLVAVSGAVFFAVFWSHIFREAHNTRHVAERNKQRETRGNPEPRGQAPEVWSVGTLDTRGKPTRHVSRNGLPVSHPPLRRGRLPGLGDGAAIHTQRRDLGSVMMVHFLVVGECGV